MSWFYLYRIKDSDFAPKVVKKLKRYVKRALKAKEKRERDS